MILTTLQQLHWREPLWLLLALQPLLLILLRSLWRHQRLNAYADPELQPWVIRKHRQGIIQRLLSRDSAYVLAWLLFAVAAAGPRLPQEIPGNQLAQGMDIMIVLDVSRSMSVADVLPTRLRRASLEIQELLQRTKNDRVGIIVYAARPHLFVPLTPDKKALNYYLKSLDHLPLPTHGSQAVKALEFARKELSASNRNKAILLITDGDVAKKDKAQRAQLNDQALTTAREDIPLYILGIGSVEGDAIPLAEGGWLTHNARSVISHMDEPLLQTLAQAGKGKYSLVLDDDSDWEKLYDQGMAASSAPQLDENTAGKIIWQELFSWALLPAIGLLWLSLVPYRLPFPNNTASMALLVLVLLSLSAQTPVSAANQDTEQKAWQTYHKKDYAGSLELYRKLPAFTGRIGEGASRYRLEDYTGAIRQYSQALLMAETDNERALTLYNLGNSYFQTGDYANAITAYRDAINYRPQHNPTLTNLEFSKVLQKKVDMRIYQSGKSKRMGTGSRSAQAEADIDINPAGSVSIDESGEPSGKDAAIPSLPDLDDAAITALIERGIDHVRLAAENTHDQQRLKQSRPELPLSAAMLRMRELEDQQTNLWKRIFELEEGFPASVDSPKEIPGITPW